MVANPAAVDAPQQKKRTFRTFQYRGVPLEQLMDLSTEQLMDLYTARKRRKYSRQGHQRKYKSLIVKLSKAKLGCGLGERPKVIKTHLRHCVVVPEMIGSVVGVYNGKKFVEVDVKPEMMGHYLGEFALTYTPVKHGRAGAAGARFTPLK